VDKIARVTDIMGLFNAPIDFEGVIGLLIGYFIRKIIKLLSFALGGIFSLLLYLQYQGIITMNMDKIQNHINKTTTMIFNSFSTIYQTQSQFNIASLDIGNIAIPFTGGIAIGITVGLLRG
jgi:uncharacterized membrane protein (Fun14 family)